MTLKSRLTQGEPVFGTFVFLPSPAVVEVLGLAGMDYVIVDLEHAPKDWETVENMIRAAELHGVAPLVRVSGNDEKEILQALELGAEGIVVPFVQTGKDARAAAAAMKYAPAGRRGTCTLTRAAGYGSLRASFVEHSERQNGRVVCVALVEDPIGVENIDDILAAEPGPDVIMVGRADLAASLGYPGKVDAPAVLEATERILAAIECRPIPGCTAAVGVYGPDDAPAWLAKGVRCFFYSSDGLILHDAVKATVDRFHAAVDDAPDFATR